MDDYYQLVGVDRGASRDEIDRRIREELRRWQRRTANADLDRRQEAERRVKQLGEARITLLDEAKRRTYDRQLTSAHTGQTSQPPLPAAVQPTEQTGAWLAQARDHLARSDHHSAAYAARETLRSTSAPPAEAWAVLAQANAGLGRLDDALFEARRAVAAEPGNPAAHLALAYVHEHRADWGEACRAYEEASRLAPHDETPQLGQARVLARWGRPASAMDRLERHYAATRYASPAEQAGAGSLLARGLVEAARASVQTAGTSRVGLTAEFALVQRMLDRARQVSQDPAVLTAVRDVEWQLRQRIKPSPQPSPSHQRSSGWRPSQPPPRTNPLAGIAFALAMVGLVIWFLAPAGAVLGHIAQFQIQRRDEGGRGMANAAVVVGWLVTIGLCCAGLAYYSGR